MVLLFRIASRYEKFMPFQPERNRFNNNGLNFHFVADFDFKYIHFVFCYVLCITYSKIENFMFQRKRICLRLKGLVIFLCTTFSF